MPRLIYLDNNSVTRPSSQVIAKMIPFFTERWGTPSAPHQMGQTLFPAIEEALRGIYALVGAKERDTILFTSSAAEGTNHVISSTYFDVTVHTGKNQFITSLIDEAPSMMAIERLEQLSCVSKMVAPNHYGQITAEAIADLITPRTALVSMSWANALTGVINPINDIAVLCQERGIRLHLEASHVLGKLAADWEEVPAQFLTFNGDCLHAPSGTGALYVRGDVTISPFILGGSEQAALRAGNYSVAGLVALGQAARESLDACDLMCMEVARLRSKLENELVSLIPGAIVFFRDQERLPNCTAIGFPGVSNEALLYLLNRKGVCATIGGGSHQQIGLILSASGIEESLARSAISFSLSRETTEEEIDIAIDIIVDCVNHLRRISNKWVSNGEEKSKGAL